jgi:methylenetetrahydromethanopterin dehydrogenase
MEDKVVKVCVLKLGAIGSSIMLEYLLDERAERQDIEVRVYTTGSKMFSSKYGEELARKALEEDYDLYIVASPNATVKGPTKAREVLREHGKRVIVLSDAPTKKIVEELAEKGFGYIIVTADAMIGARREFLDPIEMALFNSDIIKVLAVSGAFRAIYTEISRVIEDIKRGVEPELPKLVLKKENTVKYGEFKNPYARVKAMAAFEIARRVADVTTEGCFKVHEKERYIPLVASAHEMMRIAAGLADEARELEKSTDTVVRKPHYDDGTILYKEKLLEKPK